MRHDWEEAFVRAFIMPERQARNQELLAAPKQRRKILARLYHSLDVILTLAAEIRGGDHAPAAVERLLRAKGPGDMCYVLSPQPELDQREMPLSEALARLIEDDGVGVALCIPDRLAFYKAEDARYILIRGMDQTR